MIGEHQLATMIKYLLTVIRFNMKHYLLGAAGLLLMLAGCQSAKTNPPTTSTGARSFDQSSAAGVVWEFKPEGGDWQPIQVPAGGWRAQGYTCDAGTYRTWITMPQFYQGQRVQLAFDAINFGADISAGPNAENLVPVAHHVDGWLPVTADLTSLATPGGKLLVQVDAAGRKKFMVNGKYTVPEGATWYKGLEEGIIRGVHLNILHPVRVADVFIQTQIAPDTFKAEVTLVNDTDVPATGSLMAALNSKSQTKFTYPKIPEVDFTLPPHSQQTVDLGPIPWNLGAQSYWWPNVPYRAGYRAQLHELALQLSFGDLGPTPYRQIFGFRQFAAVGNHYELNGVHVNLRGDNQQEANFGTDAYGIKPGFGRPTAGNPGWPQTVDNWQHLNFNVMRIHQIPPTPYMLEVCDELGLMIVEESPLRGSEGGESYGDGKTNMLNMDRELVLRDRNHPAVVIWSAANEWKDPIRDASAVIRAVDPTRVIIADGVGEMGPDVINMEHYVSGISKQPVKGGAHRTDRPYGETEAIWAADNTRQGFAWMGTSIRTRRLEGDADLRNYVLNNAWPNYVPGESNATEILEKEVKHFYSGKKTQTILPDIADPWQNPNVQLLQQCYHPLAACDIEFDRTNSRSNNRGEWPVVKPALPPNADVTRQVAVFNDEFTGEGITLAWELRQGDARGSGLQHDEINLSIPCGGFRTPAVTFHTPASGEVALVLIVRKDGRERFREDKIIFQVSTTSQ